MAIQEHREWFDEFLTKPEKAESTKQ